MTIVIARRFRGPARSGNGGYTAGLLAARLTAAGSTVTGRPDVPDASVRLRRPPPLDTRLEVDVDAGAGAGTATLRHGDEPVATASRASFERAVIDAIPYEDVVAQAGPYAGAVDHPFPGCFVCGPDRAPGDGLRLFPGSLGPGRTGCTWQPDPSIAADGVVPTELVWAALDCPGGWCSDLGGRPMVLGTMTASVLRVPDVGEPCVVLGRLDDTGDRRSATATAVYGRDGDLIGRAEAVWVRVDPDVFNRLESSSSG